MPYYERPGDEDQQVCDDVFGGLGYELEFAAWGGARRG
jgi:hypothetical protein